MKNTMIDVNNHLLAQLERLGDEKLTGDALDAEIRRADAVAKTAKAATDNARLILDAARFAADAPSGRAPKLLSAD